MISHAIRLLAVLLVAIPATTQAETAPDVSVLELVEECDILAAHPADPERMSDGIADDQIVPKLAQIACEDALERDAENPRFRFQLGRALLAAHEEKKAVDLFQKAADAGYATAWAYLGDAYQFGLGVDVDGRKALTSYTKALDSGFREADAQIKQLQFDRAMYAQPFPGLFFQGQYEDIKTLSNDPQNGPLNRNYAFNFIQSLMLECEPFLQPKNIPALYAYRYPRNWKIDQDDNVIVAIQTSVAEYDAETFLRRHVCDGLIAKHMFQSINLFLENKP
jgi:hypothetical protein